MIYEVVIDRREKKHTVTRRLKKTYAFGKINVLHTYTFVREMIFIRVTGVTKSTVHF